VSREVLAATTPAITGQVLTAEEGVFLANLLVKVGPPDLERQEVRDVVADLARAYATCSPKTPPRGGEDSA
jgi:hypothetical protein